MWQVETAYDVFLQATLEYMNFAGRLAATFGLRGLGAQEERLYNFTEGVTRVITFLVSADTYQSVARAHERQLPGICQSMMDEEVIHKKNNPWFAFMDELRNVVVHVKHPLAAFQFRSSAESGVTTDLVFDWATLEATFKFATGKGCKAKHQAYSRLLREVGNAKPLTFGEGLRHFAPAIREIHRATQRAYHGSLIQAENELRRLHSMAREANMDPPLELCSWERDRDPATVDVPAEEQLANLERFARRHALRMQLTLPPLPTKQQRLSPPPRRGDQQA